ncbi:MAG: M20 family metallopeptidase [Dehalococcoidia bacterium]|nr:M20 family metallopeptidase [Dehalococcoidia bacterium]
MDVKNAAKERLDGACDGLTELSHRIHANPELGFQEEKASRWLAETLSEAGFDVQHPAYDLPTAFVARAGHGPLHVAICAEYDCLPGIGHACGHNIIATAGAGAGIALAQIADEAGLTVSVVGTPAEEGGGGKIILLDRGAFSGVHAAMMVHPSPADVAEPPIIAVSHFDVYYTGKEAHASSYPQQGINAADALTIAQVAIGLLRQHIRPNDRIHGIVTKGGDAPNIVPAHTSAKYYVRAKTLGQLEDIRARVDKCFEAGALATGAKLEIVEAEKPYSHMEHDSEIAAVYRHNAEALGRIFPDFGPAAERWAGSTDMGNISLELPAIHPMIGIDSLPAVNHQPEFTERCATASADKAVYDGALAMAWTAIDLAADGKLRDRLLQSRKDGS